MERSRNRQKSSSPVSARVQKSRKLRQQSGLKRVEVLVPQNKADLIKAYAAQLREGSESESLIRVRKLLAQAYKKYYARYLDNIRIKPEKASFSDAMIVASALMHRGNSEAYKLGRQIQRLAK